MSKKYELLKDAFILCMGQTLYRIRALKDFSDIKAGDLGGYIANESNLSHEGDCWVYKNAIVYSYAKIYDNAQISGHAKIFGSAKIHENARILGDAEIYGKARIFGDAKIFGKAQVLGDAEIYDKAQVFGYALVHRNAKIHGVAEIHGNSTVSGTADITKGNVIGKISMPYKKLFQHQCTNRMLTAILTENDQILYSIACQDNITEEEFINRIYNNDGGLTWNPHREEYLALIPAIKIYFKAE